MKYSVYCNFDKLSGFYGAPWLSVNDDTAKRQFAQMCVNMTYDCRDVELYKLGEFDATTAAFELFEKPMFVKRGERNE